jgi:hypothetical protein
MFLSQNREQYVRMLLHAAVELVNHSAWYHMFGNVCLFSLECPASAMLILNFIGVTAFRAKGERLCSPNPKYVTHYVSLQRNNRIMLVTGHWHLCGFCGSYQKQGTVTTIILRKACTLYASDEMKRAPCFCPLSEVHMDLTRDRSREVIMRGLKQNTWIQILLGRSVDPCFPSDAAVRKLRLANL